MKIKIAWVFILTCLAFIANAQPYASNNGVFLVDQIKGCAPLTITLTVPSATCDPLNDINCDFFYVTGMSIQNVFTHTYTDPGTYSVIGVFQGGITDRITITVLPNTPPEFEIYSCDENTIQVNVTDSNYDQYVINYNDGTPDIVVPKGNLARDMHSFTSSGNKTVTVRGRNLNADDNCNPSSKQVLAREQLPIPTITELRVVNDREIELDLDVEERNTLYRLQISRNNATSFQNLQNVYEANSVTVNNLQTDQNYYCFRIGVFDPCDNTTYYGNTICSSNFDVTALNNVNRIQWATTPAGIASHSISKSNTTPLSASGGVNGIDDTNITCGVEYCYQQTMVYSNGSRSISLQKCVSAISTNTPTVIENISTVVGANEVTLQWTQDPAFIPTAYTVSKTVNGTFSNTNTTTTPTLVDEPYVTEATTCYSITYTDACDNKSPVSLSACPIQLTAVLESGNVVNLSWTAYEGWKQGVHHYIIERYNADGSLISSTNATATSHLDETQDQDNQVLAYRIVAVANQGGIPQSISNTIRIIKEPNLFHPTAFTPNADGLNDVFNVFGQYVDRFEMQIFNRWGEMMFHTEDLNEGWDGRFKGTLMPEGTYVFRATITDQAGRSFERSGTLVLLRKQ